MTEQNATTPLPNWGDIVPFYGNNWYDDLPDGPAPYYAHAKNGTFLHRRTAQGRGLIRTYKTPPRLGELKEHFRFDGPEITAKTYAQAVDFFRRIWNTRRTEAELIITQNQTTKEYRLFVPTQQVSHGGVYSIYNPEHIARDHLVVGTFHSHCDFSPSHSGTDEGDARDMDGIHGTIGYVDRETPEMDLMYALNKTFYQFTIDKLEDGQETFLGIVDMLDLSAGTAPEWWDKYVLHGHVTDDQRQEIAPYADDEAWERFMGRYRPPKPAHTYQHQAPPSQIPAKFDSGQRDYRDRWDDASNAAWLAANGYVYDEKLRTYRWQSQTLKESQEFNRSRWTNWDDHGALLPDNFAYEEPDYWEDALGRPFIDSLFNTGLFTEDDLDRAIRDWPASGTHPYWNKRIRAKLIRASDWLQDQGFNVNVRVTEPVLPVPGQTTVIEHLEAADQT